MTAASDLEQALLEAQARGFLGPGPVGPQLDHALAFATMLGGPSRALDLGSGGGLPGLVLAMAEASTTWVLLDANRRRTDFLTEMTVRLGLAGRVQVVCGRAETVGRNPDHRAGFDAVVARSFGPPAVTAECASPLLALGGVLVVSEPPEAAEGRWSGAGLDGLGLAPDGRAERPTLVRFRKTAPTSDRYPRRVGVPAKRPLWEGST